MAYKITPRRFRWGFTGFYDVTVNGKHVGAIEPFYKTLDSLRPSGYRTEVMLEWDSLADDTGFPNEYRTLKEAKEAVADLMSRNGE